LVTSKKGDGCFVGGRVRVVEEQWGGSRTEAERRGFQEKTACRWIVWSAAASEGSARHAAKRERLRKRDGAMVRCRPTTAAQLNLIRMNGIPP
jgi:hypothetical protein